MEQLQIASLYEIGWGYYLQMNWFKAVECFEEFLERNKTPSFRAFCGFQLVFFSVLLFSFFVPLMFFSQLNLHFGPSSPLSKPYNSVLFLFFYCLFNPFHFYSPLIFLLHFFLLASLQGICYLMLEEKAKAKAIFLQVPSFVRRHFTYDQYAARKAIFYSSGYFLFFF